MNNGNTSKLQKRWIGWVLLVCVMIGVFLLGILGASILERRQEARIQPPLKDIGQWETDSAKWRDNFPREYSSYIEMKDSTTRTAHGGSFPRDYLEETPANVVLFAGYGFSMDYLQGRGHVYAIEDVTKTKRVNDKTVATCWSCKSPDVPRLMNTIGVEKFYASNFHDFKNEITHPIGCLDCHEPNTMKLRISRPALREALERQGRNIEEISHQEMRTLVCAQCHVEYYFKGSGNYLTFPWDNGFEIEKIDQYYDDIGFADWTHAISRTKMVKLQHPDYEIFQTGIHSYRQVSCADCHMPYRTEGGAKYTNHHIQSPLLDIANSCAVCHRWSESDIRKRVEGIQEKVHEARQRTERAIAYAHFDIAACIEAGLADADLEPVRNLVRKAQLRWDFVAANNGMGFHSGQECVRILGASNDLAQECRVMCTRLLATKGYSNPVHYPDFSTKNEAQTLIKAFVENTSPKLMM